MRCKKASLTPVIFMKLKLRLDERTSLRVSPAKMLTPSVINYFGGWGGEMSHYAIQFGLPFLSLVDPSASASSVGKIGHYNCLDLF